MRERVSVIILRTNVISHGISFSLYDQIARKRESRLTGVLFKRAGVILGVLLILGCSPSVRTCPLFSKCWMKLYLIWKRWAFKLFLSQDFVLIILCSCIRFWRWLLCNFSIPIQVISVKKNRRRKNLIGNPQFRKNWYTTALWSFVR